MIKLIQTSLIAVLLGLLANTTLFAQNEVDALRYSQSTFGGTARFMGMAGAFGALGGDLSVASYNPAGLAVYRGSEFSFSPTLFWQQTNSKYYGSASRDFKVNPNFTNIGLVLTELAANSDENEWVGMQLTFTFNRINNFNNRTYIEGINNESSLTDHYLGEIQGLNSSEISGTYPFGPGLAWNAYLINPVDTFDSTSYISMIRNGGINQSKSITRSGGINELSVSLSANYNNRLYIGGSLGFPLVNYTEESTYRENDNEDTIAYFSSFKLNERVNTSGTGFNFKFGVIFRATDWLRLGGSVHTPTLFKLSDDYSASLYANYDSVPEWSGTGEINYEANSPQGNFNYRIITPLKLTGSLAIIVGKKGLVSADYEFIDYSMARISSSGYTFTFQNTAIQQTYAPTGNLRMGTEWRILPFSIRGGYALYGSPFKGGLSEGARTSYTLGLGFRQQKFFLDLAYAFTQTTEKYYLYSADLVDASTHEMNSHQITTTMGFRF